MPEYQEQFTTHVDMHGSLMATYEEATFKRIAEDAIFFRQQAAQGEIDEKQRKRYAMVIVLLMSFYLESMSKLICEAVVNKGLEDVDKRGDLPKAIRRFRAVHSELLGKELTLNTDGIQDIFTIRNKIIAHPAGRGKLQTNEFGWSPVNQQFTYRKFKNFPFVYSHFTLREADAVLKEVYEFLTEFLRLLTHKLSKEQVDELWPQELGEWNK